MLILVELELKCNSRLEDVGFVNGIYLVYIWYIF